MIEGFASESGSANPIVLCCEPSAAPALTEELELRGIPVLHWPGVEIVPAIPGGGLDTFPDALAWSDCVVFPNSDVVRALRALFPDLTATLGASSRCAARSEATARPLRNLGVEVDLVPDLASEPTFSRYLLGALPRGARTLVFDGAGEAKRLVTALAEGGLDVRVQGVYTHARPTSPQRSARFLRCVVFGSPSSSQALLLANPWLLDVPAVAIGAPTADWLRQEGRHRDVVEVDGRDSSQLLEVLLSFSELEAPLARASG